jgi:hypothetical protein
MQNKQYIVFINDHSGSMTKLKSAAIKDYNRNIQAVVNAANQEKLDTIVSVIDFGFAENPVIRTIVNSNPHTLLPINKWDAKEQTPLYDAIVDAINLCNSLPDASESHVSFLIMITTDGGENSSRINSLTIKLLIRDLDERWTIVCRVPKNASDLSQIGIPKGNIQVWDTTSEGMEKATQANRVALTTYFKERSTGKTNSSSFYSSVENVNTNQLEDITSKVSLYVVPDKAQYDRTEIMPFILEYRMKFLKGSAFYQLIKTEARVQPEMLILIRDRTTGKVFVGNNARDMLGLSKIQNVRLHPGDHGNYDIFIQSMSHNRLLPRGSGVLYWAEIGVPFTEEDLNQYEPKKVDGVVELPEVKGKTTPTKSPIPIQHKVRQPSNVYFKTRGEARTYAKQQNTSVTDMGKSNQQGRWCVII